MYYFCEPTEFLARLEGYVNIETPSADREQMEKLNLLLEQDLKDAGAVVTRHAAFQNSPCLLVKQPQSWQQSHPKTRPTKM